MNKDRNFLERLQRIVIYRKGSERAPHKPLYLLYCIASLQHGLPRLQAFSVIEPKLKEGLIRFGLSTKSVSPQYPFWRLQNDGLAVVEPSGPYQIRKQSDDPTKSSLLSLNAHGGFTESDFEVLKGDLDLQTLAVHKILDGHFARSIHEEIIEFFDLRLAGARAADQHTEAEFRHQVLLAYGNTCALSGFSLGYRGSFPGLEAAHICWPQAGGNDDVCNGIAMTTLHRKLFHLGMFGIDEDMKVIVGNEVAEMSRATLTLSKLAGRRIRLPLDQCLWPSAETLQWHRKWVFRN
jgi:putative restriction endonuclease